MMQTLSIDLLAEMPCLAIMTTIDADGYVLATVMQDEQGRLLVERHGTEVYKTWAEAQDATIGMVLTVEPQQRVIESGS